MIIFYSSSLAIFFALALSVPYATCDSCVSMVRVFLEVHPVLFRHISKKIKEYCVINNYLCAAMYSLWSYMVIVSIQWGYTFLSLTEESAGR